MSNERDIHFRGFAELLANDLAALNSRQWESLDDYITVKRLLIAQRTYDLVLFIFQNDWFCHNPEHKIRQIPDLTDWNQLNPERNEASQP
ncbi:MAG TPA: hypothetical protein VFA10_14495 [Ktedonobacteraceae bacterium]|nr:hypothetical protein [Ktedonobacteraceae bacterium]